MAEISSKQNIIFSWLKWHFFEAPKSILQIWRNFLKFNFDFFSVGVLIRTLFSPWKKNQWSYGRGFDIGRYFSVLFSNLISRILGAVVRLFLIIFGLLIEIFIFLGGAFVFLFWIIMPVLLIFGFWLGLKIVF